MTERRRWLRFETALSALCEIVRDKQRASSKVKNISKEGALVVLNRPLKEGEEINISMDIPGDNIPIFASGEVAWQREGKGSDPDTLYETGVKFTKMQSSDKGKLLEYIYTQWLRLLDRIP